MGYRIEFFESETAAPIASPLSETRYPIFISAVAAARSGAQQLVQGVTAPVQASIFDRHERLAGTLRLAGREAA